MATVDSPETGALRVKVVFCEWTRRIRRNGMPVRLSRQQKSRQHRYAIVTSALMPESEASLRERSAQSQVRHRNAQARQPGFAAPALAAARLLPGHN